MAETRQSQTPPDIESRSAAKPGKHVHHGRTLAAWVGSMSAMVGTILGGIAVMVQNWWLFAVAAVIVVAGLVAAKVLQTMGHGAS